MMQKPRKHPCHCQPTWTCKDNPKCPKWHQTALRLTSVAMVTLVATVIGLTVWVSHLRIYSCSDNPSERFSSDNGTKDYSCMNLSPRKQQNSTNFIRNPSQNLCPNDWVQKKGKCYNFFKTYQSWIDSQKFCSTMKSHLLVIQDKAELDFLQSNIQDGIYFWIGLNISNPQKMWTWLDGTPLNLQLETSRRMACMDYNSDLSMMKVLSLSFRCVNYILRTYQPWLYSVPSIHFQVCPGFRLSPIQY
nr:killer cell lectin-like receptor subfamily F member 1 [Odocoileus virginianus texanus]